jgi:hypothetical protein
MYDFWKTLSLRSRLALGSTLVLVGWFFFSLLLQWIAGRFLYSLAWQYSAIVTIPLGLYFAIFAYNSSEFRQQMGRQFWPGVFMLPLITYGMLGLAIMKMPGPIVYLLPFQRSTEIVSVKDIGPNPQQCLGKSAIVTDEYPSFLQTGVCIEGEVAGLLKPGDTLAIEGKKGMGGMLIQSYRRIAASKLLAPPR